jgi:ABC-type iron transport system FetAB ATPase subunit
MAQKTKFKGYAAIVQQINCNKLPQLTGETVLDGVHHPNSVRTHKTRLQRSVDTSSEFIHDIQRAFLL